MTRLITKGAPYGNRNAAKDYAARTDAYESYTAQREPWLKNLSHEQFNAIASYSAGGYGVTNRMLRNKLIAKDKMWRQVDIMTPIKHMRAAATPLSEDTFVYRGTRKKPEGDSIDKGFTSTSLFPSMAAAFTRKTNGENVARVRVPKGTPVLYGVSDLVKGGVPEYEVILMPGGKFKALPRSEQYHEFDYEPAKSK